MLATGLAANRGNCQWPDDERVIDGWDEAGCTRAAAGGRVLLVGAGLSAVDVMTLLMEAGHRDEIVVLSRHGMLPRPHAARIGSVHLPTSHTPAPDQLRALMRWIRTLVLESERNGVPWQHAIDALRPQLPYLWQKLSARDRARFVHRVRPYRDVLRHRAPKDVPSNIEQQRTQGRVQIFSGRVLGCHAREQGIDVSLRLRGGACRIERFSHVVRCFGPALSADASTSPLFAAMVRSGLALRDAAGLGIATLEHGRLIDAAGQPSRQYFALGAPCRASRWETTSVPEIVADAVALAHVLSAEALAPCQLPELSVRSTTADIGTL